MWEIGLFFFFYMSFSIFAFSLFVVSFGVSFWVTLIFLENWQKKVNENWDRETEWTKAKNKEDERRNMKKKGRIFHT